MEITLLNPPEGNVLARGSYYGGPHYEFAIECDGCVYFRVVGEADRVWAGPDAASFRRIVEAWNRFKADVVQLPSKEAQLDRVIQLRREFESLGAMPKDLPPDPEPLWSLLLFEAENELG